MTTRPLIEMQGIKKVFYTEEVETWALDDIARALVGKPKVLLADEPTGNLDSKNAQLVMDLLASLHTQGSCIVMVTHDPHWAEQAGRQVSLFDGKITDDRRLSRPQVISGPGHS